MAILLLLGQWEMLPLQLQQLEVGARENPDTRDTKTQKEWWEEESSPLSSLY